MRSKKLLVILFALIILFAGYLGFVKLFSRGDTVPNQQFTSKEFVGDQKCQGCHLKEHEAWKTSDHYKAMLPPSESTVFGNFNNAVYSADGVTSRFFKQGSDFIINTEGPDGKNHDYKVLYTFGHY